LDACRQSSAKSPCRHETCRHTFHAVGQYSVTAGTQLSTQPGPTGSNAFGWAYIASFNIK
jgi:hypothetical protein